MSDTFHLTIPDEAWRAVGEPDGDDPDRVLDGREHLICALVINGTSHHLEAHEVDVIRSEEDSYQQFFLYDEQMDHIHAGVAATGRWTTTKIDGREYVLVASPYC